MTTDLRKMVKKLLHFREAGGLLMSVQDRPKLRLTFFNIFIVLTTLYISALPPAIAAPADDFIKDCSGDSTVGDIWVALMFTDWFEDRDQLVLFRFIESGFQTEGILNAAYQAIFGDMLTVPDLVIHALPFHRDFLQQKTIPVMVHLRFLPAACIHLILP